jgi:hypothetical protein
MEITALLAVFVVGPATTKVYQRYRSTRKIAWSSVVMALVFCAIVLDQSTVT